MNSFGTLSVSRRRFQSQSKYKDSVSSFSCEFSSIVPLPRNYSGQIPPGSAGCLFFSVPCFYNIFFYDGLNQSPLRPYPSVRDLDLFLVVSFKRSEF